MKDEKYVNVRGIRTRYFEKGTGNPLVLIHGGQYGFYYSANSWSLNFDELATKFHVYAFDKLGMGFTDPPGSDKEFTIDSTVDHAFGFITHMGMEKISVVGHSRGAYVAARIALEHPSLIRTLCVVDSNTLAQDHPNTPTDFYARIEAAAPEVPTYESVQAEALANSYSSSHLTQEFVGEMLEISKSPTIQKTRSKMEILGPSLFLPDINIKRAETIQRISKGLLTCPTVLFWGLNDPSAPVVLAHNLFDLISQTVDRSQLHIFNRAGHYSFREHPRDFDSCLTSFISLS